MHTFSFCLTFSVPVHNTDADIGTVALPTHPLWISDALLAALGDKCDDAVIGIGVVGRISLEVEREAPTLEAAMWSVVCGVAEVVPEAVLINVGVC